MGDSHQGGGSPRKWATKAEYNRARKRRRKGMVDPPGTERGGECEICRRTFERLVLDHCHKTGRIRGWLCRNCNLGMGLLGDSQDGLLNAVAYLKSKE